MTCAAARASADQLGCEVPEAVARESAVPACQGARNSQHFRGVGVAIRASVVYILFPGLSPLLRPGSLEVLFPVRRAQRFGPPFAGGSVRACPHLSWPRDARDEQPAWVVPPTCERGERHPGATTGTTRCRPRCVSSSRLWPRDSPGASATGPSASPRG